MPTTGTRLMLPLVILLLAGCAHGPDAPSSPPPKGAGDLRRFVGLRVADMMLDLPKPLLAQGERILGEPPWGLVAAATEDGRELILLDRMDERPSGEMEYEVEAVLALPAGTTWETKAWDACALRGQPDSRLVAVLEPHDGCSPQDAPASRAWRVDPAAKRFVEIDPAAVRCRRPRCEQDLDQPGPTGAAGNGRPATSTRTAFIAEAWPSNCGQVSRATRPSY